MCSCSYRQEANGHLLLLQHGDLSLRAAALLDGSTADFAFGPPRQRASRASASAAAAKIFCRKYEADEAQIASIVDFYVELYASALEYHQRIEAARFVYQTCVSRAAFFLSNLNP
jgi:hypothetical protein